MEGDILEQDNFTKMIQRELQVCYIRKCMSCHVIVSLYILIYTEL